MSLFSLTSLSVSVFSVIISPLVFKLPAENNNMPLFFSFNYLGEESVSISGFLGFFNVFFFFNEKGISW